MIHRYNLADLNLSDRAEKAPAYLGFQQTETAAPYKNWETTAQSSYGHGHKLTAMDETKKFDYL